jgi:glycosyltransferase involved in cell wall biosynthesis
MSKNNPLLSIITVCHNASDTIEETFISIGHQTNKSFEYIVIDGNSSDGTLNIIKKYDSLIDYWLSESDNGISEAMNKGVKKARGKYIFFLHADDYLYNEASTNTIITNIINNPDIHIYAYDIFYKKNATLKRRSPRGFNFWFNFKTGLYHQGTICNRTLFEIIGFFDTDIKVAMDYDWFIRAFRHSASLVKIPLVISVMRDTGISSRRDWNSLSNRLHEEKIIHYKNLSGKTWNYFYATWWAFYPLYKKYIS